MARSLDKPVDGEILFGRVPHRIPSSCSWRGQPHVGQRGIGTSNTGDAVLADNPFAQFHLKCCFGACCRSLSSHANLQCTARLVGRYLRANIETVRTHSPLVPYGPSQRLPIRGAGKVAR